MESAQIVFRWGVLLFDGLSFAIFGIAAFILLFFSPYLAAGGDEGHSVLSFEGLLIFAMVAATWGLICAWFVYSSKFRHERVRGIWLPAFWATGWAMLFWIGSGPSFVR